MPRKRPGRPMWFRTPLSIEPIIKSFPAEDVGTAYKLAMEYFKDKTLPGPDTPIMALSLFSILKTEIDNSFEEYEQAKMDGMKARLSTRGTGG